MSAATVGTIKRVTKRRVLWDGLVPNLVKLLRAWEPGIGDSERDFRNQLADLLRTNTDASRVEVEYRHEGTTADVYLGWPSRFGKKFVLFELKLDLNRKSEFDRLLGQIEQLGPRQYNIIIVLFGDTDPALLGRLRERYPERLEDGRALVIIEKPKSSGAQGDS